MPLIHRTENARLVTRGRLACWLALGATLAINPGCSNTETAPTQATEAATPSTATPPTTALPPLPDEPVDTELATGPSTSTASEMPAPSLGFAGPPDDVPATNSPLHEQPVTEQPATKEAVEPVLSIADSEMDKTGKPRLQLPQELPPDKLIDVLAAADQDMEHIYSGRAGLTNQAEAVAEMQRIIQLKLQAARRLAESPTATAQQRTVGKRGELQALSHLASSGNLKAAEELETIAKAGLASGEPSVVSDSRLVLIGFALEALQNGQAEAPQRIVELVQQHSPSTETADVPALMVMGQAREMLAQYGHIEEAKRVRETILNSFASSDDPEVAMMAAKLAGAVQFDRIDKLRADAIAEKQIDIAAWKAACQTLINESPDLLTVQYLASTALELEGTENDLLASATYELLEKNFGDRNDSLAREVMIAIEARKARQAIIGTPLSVDLPSLEGETIEMSDYLGRIVLLPFWAAEFPASMQLFPNLVELRKQHPNDVAIVGVNLDSRADERIANAKEKLGFPSLHSVTDPNAEVPNPLVKEFGMVSMPFLVVVDRQGNVADICFTQRKLNDTMTRLLATTE